MRNVDIYIRSNVTLFVEKERTDASTCNRLLCLFVIIYQKRYESITHIHFGAHLRAYSYMTMAEQSDIP
jgi:hypothetical protein